MDTYDWTLLDTSVQVIRLGPGVAAPGPTGIPLTA